MSQHFCMPQQPNCCCNNRFPFPFPFPCCNTCCDKHHCKKSCRDEIAQLLMLINSLQVSISDPTLSEIDFYSDGFSITPTTGNLLSINKNCDFTIAPTDGSNNITLVTDTLKALQINSAPEEPSLFTLLLGYLESLPPITYYYCNYYKRSCSDKCDQDLQAQLENLAISESQVTINFNKDFVTGVVYRIDNCIAYLLDNLECPNSIYAIPICQIFSYKLLDI